MSDFWKGVFTVLTLQWLFGKGDGASGCGCSGCLTVAILALCLIFYLLGLFDSPSPAV